MASRKGRSSRRGGYRARSGRFSRRSSSTGSRRRNMRRSSSGGPALRLVIESPAQSAVTPVQLAQRFAPIQPTRPKF